MEIVTDPDLRSATDAVAFAQELRRILIAANASDADMFKGMMRFDASISLRERGTEKLNPRSEIKNLNSFKALERALEYEEKRLRAMWDEGGPLDGDITVGWNDDTGKTRMLRDKESAMDYRYFPEPDIPPLYITQTFVDEITADLPLLPRQQRLRYQELGLSEAQSMMLVDQPAIAQRFDAVHEATSDAKRASSFVLTQLTGFMNSHEKNWNEAPSTEDLLALLKAVDDDTVSANASKEVLEAMVETGKEPMAIIEERGLTQVTDEGAIDTWIEGGIAANPKAIESFNEGKEQALGAVVGWVMKESKGAANPKVIMEKLREKLS
jgi:aspartyl-tRNA(Asn)/glutamyl-tRNA(Gln) amidotransferase subunit B